MVQIIIYNQEMLEVAIQDLRNMFERDKRINLSYEKAHKEKTMAQVGFVFAALINQITDYFINCGFNIDAEDVRYKLYDEVSEIIPEMVVDKQIFGGRPRIKHISEMDRELCSKFINGVFEVLNSKPMYAGLMMHPSTYYNWCFHLEPEEIQITRNSILPERDENYLNHIRSLPCICCGIQHRSEAHHIRDTRTAGTAIKSPDWYAVPLCHQCHMLVAHGEGFKDSMKWIPLDLIDFCRICYSRWKNNL